MPIGDMIIVADREGNLRAVDWKDHEIRMQRILRLHYGAGGFALETDAQFEARSFSGKYGRPCGIFAAATPFRMQNLPGKLDGQRHPEPSVWQMLKSNRSCCALSWCHRSQRVPSPDTAGVSTERDGFLNTRASNQAYRTKVKR